MRITKYTHACVVLEAEGQKLIIDPGMYTPSFGDMANVAAVVITHIHADHFYLPHIKMIAERNPNLRIFTVEQVKEKIQKLEVVAVRDGDEHTVGPFTLRFTGSMHGEVHPDWPVSVQNTGVLVNGAFYYAGDAFALPERPVALLAVPVSYAWAKMDEVIDFMAAIRPSACFVTHDNPLSEAGRRTAAGWIAKASEKYGIKFIQLREGESSDLPLAT